MGKGTHDSEATRQPVRMIGYFLNAFRQLPDRIAATVSNIRRVKALKSEVAALNAHIDLMNVCHADRITALEQEHRRKIDAQAGELRALIARVLPPDIDPHVQIIVSGETAHQLWGKVASLQGEDEPAAPYDPGHRARADYALLANAGHHGGP